MMLFEDDIIRIESRNLRAVAISDITDWPPPERLVFDGREYERVRFSLITDEERAGMTHVVRGAEYRPVKREDDRHEDDTDHWW